MTGNILDAAKEQLQHDHGHPDSDWQILSNLLQLAGDQTDVILKWAFAEHKGYTETRAKAGVKFFENNPVEAWLVLERLATSSDPDDRDTALAVLRVCNHPNAPRLARALLYDPWPYLRLNAADFLKEIVPDEVAVSLRQLLSNEEEWVRDEAKKSLIEMGENM